MSPASRGLLTVVAHLSRQEEKDHRATGKGQGEEKGPWGDREEKGPWDNGEEKGPWGDEGRVRGGEEEVGWWLSQCRACHTSMRT